jgi:hypothetical protein
LTVVMPDGRRRTYGDPGADRHAEIRVHNEAAALSLLLHGEPCMREAYLYG